MTKNYRKNPIRAALARGRLVRGAFQLLTDRAVTEIMLDAGLDYVLIDAEHRPLNPETVEDLVRTAHGRGPNKAAMVRIPAITRGAIQYALETGADGVLAPLVSSRAQAEELVSLCRYPPQGTRGLNSGMRPAGWGHAKPAEYAQAANREIIVAAQIENLSGLKALDEIATVRGLDMLYVGPFDLSHGLGKSGQLGDPEVRAAFSRIFRAGRTHRKWLGVLAPDVAFAQWCIGEGVRFLTYRSDVRTLKASAAADVASIATLKT